MSNSLPRTMRRNAAMIGSTSRYSGSKVLGLTLPSLSAWLLPCVRVTVISLGPAMAAFRSEWMFRRANNTRRRPHLAALEAALLVHDQRGFHPRRRQVILDHLGDRLEQLELVTGRPLGPERDRGLQWRASRQAAGHLRDQDRGVLWQRKARAGPGPHPVKRSTALGVSLERRPDPERLRHRRSVAARL